MKILFITPYFKPRIGGVEKHVLEVSKELIKKGHKITIVTQRHDKDLPLFEVIEKIDVYRFVDNKLTAKWWWFISKRYMINTMDIVHCQDTAAFYWFFPFKLFMHKDCFITFHGFEGGIPKIKDLVLRKIAEWLTLSNICAGGYIRKWYGTKTGYITYGGVRK